MKRRLLLFVGIFFAAIMLVACKSTVVPTPTPTPSDNVVVVKFDLNGGDSVKPADVTLEKGGKVTKPADPTREGLIFVGWEKDGEVYDFNAPVNEGFTLKATWRQKEVYTVTLDFGYDDLTEDEQVTEGGMLDKPEDPERDGYDFVGWYLDDAEFDFETVITEDITLVAQWEAIVEHTVTFDLNYAGSVPIRVTVSDGQKVQPPADPTRAGYYFRGWQLDGGAFNFNNPIRGDVTLKANWEIIPEYTVSFDLDYDGAPSVADVKVLEGQPVVLPENPTRENYTFEGWLLNGVAYNPAAPVTKDIELVAKWEPLPIFAVTFDFNYDGSPEDLVVDVMKGKVVAKPADPVREGFGFLGWFLNGAAYDFEIPISAAITLVANWEELDAYTVTFKYNDGETADLVVDVYDGQPVTKPADPESDDFVFIGWYLEEVLFDFNEPITANIILEGKWAQEFVVEFDINHELGKPVYPQLVIEGDTASLPEEQAIEFFVFLGWFLDLADEDPFDFNTPITGDIELIAKWHALTIYNIEYNNVSEGMWVYGTKYSMIEAFLLDFYEYVQPSESLEQFMHLLGQYDGTWNSMHKEKIYSGPRPEEYNENYFVSSEKYMDKWLPFFDMIHEFALIVNDSQFFFGPGTWTGFIRLRQYIVDAKPGGNETAEDMMMMPTPLVSFAPVTKHLGDAEILLPTPYREEAVFLGWYDNAEFNGDPIETLPAGTEEDKVLYAKWEEIEEYTVTFDIGYPEGIKPEDQILLEGYKATNPGTPERRPGFVFEGWFVVDGDLYNFADPVTSNIDLYAKWREIEEVSVSYEVDGVIVHIDYIEKGHAAVEFAGPEKEGYKFLGWKLGEEVFDFETLIEADIVLVAEYEELDDFTITYHLFDGEFAVGYETRDEMMVAFLTDFYNFLVEKEHLDPAVLTVTDFIHGIGKTSGFDGRYGSDHPYFTHLYALSDNEINPAKPHFINQPEYNPKWIPFMDNFDLYVNTANGDQNAWNSPYVGGLRIKNFVQGTGTEAARAVANTIPAEYAVAVFEFNREDETFNLPLAVKDGAIFDGWYESGDFEGDPITEVEKGTARNLVLYANWGAPLQKFEVTFDYGHDDKVIVATAYEGATVVEPDTPEREGYRFLGWKLGEEVYDFDTIITGDITLVAVWEESDAEYFSIEYYDDLSSFAITDRTENILEFLRDFYKFIGPSVSLSDFMHGAGKTEGFDGLWIQNETYKNMLYNGLRPTEVNNAFFASSEQYMDKWLPFFDMMDDFIRAVNPDQYFWGSSTQVGLIRIRQYVMNVKPAGFVTDAQMNMMPNPLIQYTPVNRYTEDDEILLPVPNAVEGYRFDGWYVNEDGVGEPITVIAVGTTGDLKLYAAWHELEEFFVEWDADGGAPQPGDLIVYEGDKVTKPADPVKVGFNFLGWFVGEVEYDFDLPVVADLELVAKWEALAGFTVTIKLDEDDETPVVQTVYEGGKATKPADPERRPGFEFEGWFIGEVEYNFNEVVTEDLTIVGKWRAIEEVTVSFDLGYEGAPLLDDVIIEKGTKVEEPAEPVRENYLFLGWKLGEEVYDFNEEVETDITLVAAWEEIEDFEITYNLNGGSHDALFETRDEMVVGFFTDYHAFMVEKYGYTKDLNTFMHGEGETEGYDGEYAVTNLYAADNKSIDASTGKFINQPEYNPKWIPFLDLVEEYTSTGNNTQSFWGSTWIGGLRFAPFIQGKNLWSDQAAAPAVDEILARLPEVYTLVTIFQKDSADITLPIPVKAGNEFLGWYPNADFSGDEVTVIETGTTADVEVFAKWEEVEYEITYNLDGGAFEGMFENRDDMVLAFLTEFYGFLVDTKGYTKDLDEFLHGEDKTEGYGGEYNEFIADLRALNDPSVNPDATTFVNLPQYNKWVPIIDLMEEYVGAVNAGQAGQFWGSNWTAKGRFKEFIQKDRYSAHAEILDRVPAEYKLWSVFTISSAEIVLPIPVKDGEEFSGWYDNAEFSGSPITTIPAGSVGDVELFAKWGLDEYMVDFDIGYAEGVNPDSQTVVEGNLATEPTEPEREGYDFLGWYIGEVKFTFDTPIIGDIVLLAKWEEIVEPVAFIGEAGFASIADAISAAQADDIIVLAAGEHDVPFTVDKNGLTFTVAEGEVAIISAKITVGATMVGLKFEGLEFTGDAYIHAPAKIDGFEFLDNKVYDLNLTPTEFVVGSTHNAYSRVDVDAFIRFYTLTGANQTGDVLIDGNEFKNINSNVISIDRTTVDKEIIITNNVFHNFTQSAIRFDGGYNNGSYLIKDNVFKHDERGGADNVIIFRAYAPELGNTQIIEILDNEFINVGNLSQPIYDPNYHPGSGVITFSVFNDRLTEIYINGNTFDNVARAIHFRNAGAVSDLSGDFSGNTFINVDDYYLHQVRPGSHPAPEANFQNNMFIDDEDNLIVDLAVIGSKIINNNSYDQFVGYPKIAEIVGEPENTDVVFIGVVTGFTEYNASFINYDKVWIEDETGAITIYRGTFPEDLAIGDMYKVEGKIASFNGLIQIAQNSTLTLMSSENDIIDPTVIADLDDLTTAMMAKRIDLTGEVDSISPNGQELTVLVDGKLITLRSASSSNSNAVNAHILTGIVGQEVMLKGIHVDWYNGAQLLPTLVDQIEFVPLTDAQKMALSKTKYIAQYDNNVYNMGTEIVLPTESEFGVNVSWEIDPVDAIDGGKWKDVTENTPVELKATLTIGELTEELTLNVTIKFIDSSIEQDSYEYGFDGYDLGASYADDTFNGPGNTSWEIGHSRNVDTFEIDGEGIMLRRGSDSHVTITFEDGLSEFSFEFRKAFTGTTTRTLEVYINDVLYGEYTVNSAAGADDTVEPVLLENLTYEGTVVVKIKPKVSGNHQITVDNFAWTENK